MREKSLASDGLLDGGEVGVVAERREDWYGAVGRVHTHYPKRGVAVVQTGIGNTRGAHVIQFTTRQMHFLHVAPDAIYTQLSDLQLRPPTALFPFADSVHHKPSSSFIPLPPHTHLPS
uniref:hypothetical protein n=1 Tax=Salmonella enterica TaxID=28901 RepID=UPI00398C52DD